MRFFVLVLLIVSRGVFSSVLDLPLIATDSKEVWIDTGYSTKHFDIFDYADKVSSSVRFNNESSIHLGFNYDTSLVWNKHTVVTRGHVFYRSFRADRAIEPTYLEIDQYGFAAKLQLVNQKQDQGFEFGVYHSRFPMQRFDKYQMGNVIFGEDIVLLDPDSLEPLPLLEVENKEFGVSFHYLRDLSQLWPFHLAVGYHLAQINPTVDSRLFNVTDENFLSMEVKGGTVREHIDTLKQKAPQSKAWYEHILNAQLLYQNKFSDAMGGTISLGAYYITESGYEQDYLENINITLDARLQYQVNNHLTFITSWYVASNYMLGTSPGTYNQQTAPFFKHPYSYISAGVLFTF
ncbi:hypothetical protein ACQKPX_10245 [Photobacterium sp. DNB23_23_1]